MPAAGTRAIKVEERIDFIKDYLKSNHPASCRNIWYAARSRMGREEAGNETTFRNALKIARQEGYIPYGWITDNSRRSYGGWSYHEPSVYVSYSIDPWRDVDYDVQVWCESKSIGEMIRDTVLGWQVPLYPAGGDASLTFVYEAAQRVNHRGKPHLVILYFGDYDVNGVRIPHSIEAEMKKHLTNATVKLVRVGLNEDQVAEYGLQREPLTAADQRKVRGYARAGKPYTCRFKCDAEALPANALRSLIDDALAEYLDKTQIRLAMQMANRVQGRIQMRLNPVLKAVREELGLDSL